MAHRLSLRQDAYEALERANRPGESFSDAVLRILAQERPRQKDPWIFVEARRPQGEDLDKRLAEVEEWRDADRASRDN